MSTSLVAFFSASGVTAACAERLAKAASADLFRIRPETEYSEADLDWRDPQSRSTLEMRDPASRPAFIGPLPDLAGYDTVYLGFPVWWYTAPMIIRSFLEAGDFSGKRVILFATSGGSGLGKTVQDLVPSAPGAIFSELGILPKDCTKNELADWIANADAIQPGRYRHFRGKEYEVIGLAKHSESLEEVVVYRACYGDHDLWVRPVSMWNESVTENGKATRRFIRIPDPESGIQL